MSELPEPLVPAEVDLRDFAFMPLDVVRLRDSGIAARASGEEFRAAILLWCAAWHQQPAASLSDDDAELAYLAGFGRSPKDWRKIKAGALRGWVKCADARLYHPVVAEKALEAWEQRGEYRQTADSKKERQRRWRERLRQLSAELRALGVTPPRGATLETLETLLRDAVETSQPSTQSSTQASPRDAVEIGYKGQGEGEGQGKEAASAASAAPPKRAPGDLLAERVLEACGLDPMKTAWPFTEADKWLAAGYDPERIVRTVADVMRQRRAKAPDWRPKSLSYFTDAIREAHAAKPNGVHANDPLDAARRETAHWHEIQWDRMIVGFKAKPTYWLSTAGPKPNEPGCIAPAHLLERHGFGDKSAGEGQ